MRLFRFSVLEFSAMNLYMQEGYELIGAAFAVHKQIGGGLLEEVYQECLEIELRKRQIPFKSKPELVLFYGGFELRKRYFPDLLVYEGIVAELKATSQLIPEHSAQLFNYLRVANKRVGYLLNFAPLRNLEWKRFVLEDASQPFRGPFVDNG
jgi:GxxExxY protein